MKLLRARRSGAGSPDIPLAPLIDLMFTLLIFLLVSTTFVRETGMPVERPRAFTSSELKNESILVGVGPQGEISIDGRRVAVLGVRTHVERELARRPGLSIVLIADRRTPAEWLVRVMDEARRGGAKQIAIASKKDE